MSDWREGEKYKTKGNKVVEAFLLGRDLPPSWWFEECQNGNILIDNPCAWATSVKTPYGLVVGYHLRDYMVYYGPMKDGLWPKNKDVGCNIYPINVFVFHELFEKEEGGR